MASDDEDTDFKAIKRPQKRRKSVNVKTRGKKANLGRRDSSSPSAAVLPEETTTTETHPHSAGDQCDPIDDKSLSSDEGLKYCPLCQFPFKYLVGQTKRWHLSECFEQQLTNSQGGLVF